jgi:hypothetical protein
MRRSVTREKLEVLMTELGQRAGSSGNVYFTGGATALWLGVRDQTIDVDLKFEPEPRGVFEALADLKNRLEINVELASPADFIPVLPGWEGRSPFVAQKGAVGFFHFEVTAQVLSKIERGYAQDLSDAAQFMARCGLQAQSLWAYFQQIRPFLPRYPAIDAAAFEGKVTRFLELP